MTLSTISGYHKVVVLFNIFFPRGLGQPRAAGARQAFKVKACDLGNLWPGLSLDTIVGLIEQVESPLYR